MLNTTNHKNSIVEIKTTKMCLSKKKNLKIIIKNNIKKTMQNDKIGCSRISNKLIKC